MIQSVPKHPRVIDDDFRAFIRRQPCLLATREPCTCGPYIDVRRKMIATRFCHVRLAAWLAGGYRLYRAANARTWVDVPLAGAATLADGTPDPSFGQRSNADARRAWLEHYAWLHAYGPTLLLLLDRALLDGAVEQAYRAARDGAEIQDL